MWVAYRVMYDASFRHLVLTSYRAPVQQVVPKIVSPVSCIPHWPQLSSSVFTILFFHLPTGPLSVLTYVYQVAAGLPHLSTFPSPHPDCCLSACLFADTPCRTPSSVISVVFYFFSGLSLPSAALFASLSAASFPSIPM